MTDAAFREAYRENKDTLYRFAWRMTGSATVAEDIVQDCFLILWRRSGYRDDRGTMRSFLLGVTRNLVLKRLTRERTHQELDECSAVCGPFDAVGLERSEMVARAVAALPSLQREALVLAEYEGLSLEEISLSCGADLAAVKSRLHRARQNLRRLLTPLLQAKGAACETDG